MYNSCGGENLDIGCDGVCFSGLVLDECDVCDGPGAIYECGCFDSEVNYDCNGLCINDSDGDLLCDEYEIELPYQSGDILMPEHQNMNFLIKILYNDYLNFLFANYLFYIFPKFHCL